KTARSGEDFSRLQSLISRNIHGSIDEPVAFDFNRKRKSQWNCFDVADGFSHRSIPKGNNRDAATVAAFDHFSHCVDLGEALPEFEHVIFAPVNACALVRPHVITLTGNATIKAMLLRDGAVNLEVRRSAIFVFRAG